MEYGQDVKGINVGCWLVDNFYGILALTRFEIFEHFFRDDHMYVCIIWIF